MIVILNKKLLILIALSLLLISCTNSSHKIDSVNSVEYTDMILSCFSAKDFSNEAVSAESVKTILSAGIQAPSILNAQICRFTVINNIDVKNEIMPEMPDECVMIITSVPMVNQHHGASGELMSGLATQNMYIAAQALGLGACIYSEPVARINYSLRDSVTLPNDYEAVTLLVVGHVENFAHALSGASTRQSFDSFVNYVY